MRQTLEILVKSRGSKKVKAEFNSLIKKVGQMGKTLKLYKRYLHEARLKIQQLTKKIAELNKQNKKTTKSTSGFGKSLKNFNRTMFASTAIVAMFTNGIRGIFNVMSEGADFARIEKQFENVFGTNSNITKSLAKFTDNFIDIPEAMKSALALKRLGIVGNLDKASKLIAQAGTAAKMSGLESGEGINHFTKFLKDGAISHLEHLNLTNRTNEAFATQMSVLKGRGGLLGGVVAQQYKLIFAQRLLNRLTRDSMFGNRDQKDTLQELAQEWRLLKIEIGSLIFDALKPLIQDYLIPALKWTREWIKRNKDVDSSLVNITREVLLFAGAIGTLVTTLTALSAVSGVAMLLKGGVSAIGGLGLAGEGAAIAGLGGAALLAGKIGLLIVTIGALGYILYKIYDYFTTDKAEIDKKKTSTINNVMPEVVQTMKSRSLDAQLLGVNRGVDIPSLADMWRGLKDTFTLPPLPTGEEIEQKREQQRLKNNRLQPKLDFNSMDSTQAYNVIDKVKSEEMTTAFSNVTDNSDIVSLLERLLFTSENSNVELVKANMNSESSKFKDIVNSSRLKG